LDERSQLRLYLHILKEWESQLGALAELADGRLQRGSGVFCSCGFHFFSLTLARGPFGGGIVMCGRPVVDWWQLIQDLGNGRRVEFVA
jgi:hypothetical protein